MNIRERNQIIQQVLKEIDIDDTTIVADVTTKRAIIYDEVEEGVAGEELGTLKWVHRDAKTWFDIKAKDIEYDDIIDLVVTENFREECKTLLANLINHFEEQIR